ncbi:MAG: RNA polymerase sigma factor [Rhodocyclales bacterium]|nr:RNA polymerase sigma factor [Rhodocyclales bacterium]
MPILSLLFHSRQWRQSLEAARPGLYRVAYAWCRDAALADDLTQEATAKALERGDQLRDPTRMKSWLFAILSRCWHDHLRSRHPQQDIDELAEEHLAGDSSPADDFERRQTVARVRTAVARLPVGQRQVLTLVDLEEFSYAEVGEILGIPIGTVMSRLCRGRRALRDELLRAEATTPLRRIK